MIKIRRSKSQTIKYGKPITVLVGKSKEEFHIHEDLICPSSDFFKAAMRNECRESLNRTVDLPEEDPELFEVYRQWLYSGRICTVEDVSDSDKGTEESRNLARAYVLGERLQDTGFKDAVMDSLIEHSNAQLEWSIDIVKIIWEGTTPASPARQYLIDRFVHKGNQNWLSELRDVVTEDFVFDVAVALLKCRACPDGTNPSKEEGTCRYHGHTKEDKPCYKNSKSS